ncbi:MAG: membrane protein insertion efficiency factor YidD [Planctomycetia bacterium]|nr:membrane protein insertion efficiency factor YidD [Planctomycetia bacterium]
MTDTLAIGLISLYQRYISPYKGFCCAHRVQRGGLSCSEFAKQAIRECGIFRGCMQLLRRFRECGGAARALRFSQADASGPPNQKSIFGDSAIECGAGACEACGCLAEICSAL